MTRVATVPIQRNLASAMQKAQAKLAETQLQLQTTKKASNYADLGTEAVRTLSAHTMLAREDAQSTVAKRVGTTLSLYQANIEAVQDSMTSLKNDILTAIGTGDAGALQDAMNQAFAQYRGALNASEGGSSLFGGSQIDGTPFSPSSLADVATTSADDAFHDDQIKATARVGDNVDMTYGVTASGLGKDMYAAFQTMAAMGNIEQGGKLTDDQKTALAQVADQITAGMKSVSNVNALNGRNQAQIDTLTKRSDERSLLLEGVIADNEDADLGQVAIDITQQQTVLQASYSVFSQLSGLSLINYLK